MVFLLVFLISYHIFLGCVVTFCSPTGAFSVTMPNSVSLDHCTMWLSIALEISKVLKSKGLGFAQF